MAPRPSFDRKRCWNVECSNRFVAPLYLFVLSQRFAESRFHFPHVALNQAPLAEFRQGAAHHIGRHFKSIAQKGAGQERGTQIGDLVRCCKIANAFDGHQKARPVRAARTSAAIFLKSTGTLGSRR